MMAEILDLKGNVMHPTELTPQERLSVSVAELVESMGNNINVLRGIAAQNTLLFKNISYINHSGVKCSLRVAIKKIQRDLDFIESIYERKNT